ncbi:MAG: hypothetical protein HYW24_02250 [Candidatus Aenigmarchaeota archaeon]|nr:hypothetical protein [Candidatus Aenigmarchaeota archaeon]
MLVYHRIHEDLKDLPEGNKDTLEIFVPALDLALYVEYPYSSGVNLYIGSAPVPFALKKHSYEAANHKGFLTPEGYEVSGNVSHVNSDTYFFEHLEGTDYIRGLVDRVAGSIDVMYSDVRLDELARNALGESLNKHAYRELRAV